MRRIRTRASTRRPNARKGKRRPSGRGRRRQTRRDARARARRAPSKPLMGSGLTPRPCGLSTRLGVMRALPRRFRRPRRREPSKAKELGRITVKMRLTVHITVQRVPTPESKRRPLLSWCNERTGLATMLMLVATILILGLMVWQQFTGPPPWLACPPATRVCVVNTITNNFYGPVQVHVGPRGAADARSSSRYDGANKRPGGDRSELAPVGARISVGRVSVAAAVRAAGCRRSRRSGGVRPAARRARAESAET